MQFFVNLQLKENMNYKGIVPARDVIRKILVLKIKRSFRNRRVPFKNRLPLQRIERFLSEWMLNICLMLECVRM